MSLPTYTKTYHTTTYSSISPTLPALSTAGKVVLITGAGSGIGSSIALSFAASGPKALVLLGRTSLSLLAVKGKIESQVPAIQILTFTADITDGVTIEKVFKEVKDKFGGIDILVQNAAYFPTPTPISTSDVDEYFSGLEVNVKGNLIVTKAFVANLRERGVEKGAAVVIHVTTAGVHLHAMPVPMSAYVVSKIAGAKMMEYLSVELQSRNVRVLNVHPGIHDTLQGEKAGSVGLVMPFDDVKLPADFMVWAASPQANFLNGKMVWANWDVDELVAKKEEISGGSALTLGLNGWP